MSLFIEICPNVATLLTKYIDAALENVVNEWQIKAQNISVSRLNHNAETVYTCTALIRKGEIDITLQVEYANEKPTFHVFVKCDAIIHPHKSFFLPTFLRHLKKAVRKFSN